MRLSRIWELLTSERRLEREAQRQLLEDMLARANGKEVVPPWVRFPDEEPSSPIYRQGGGEGWMGWVFVPFWKNLTREEAVDYVAKWEAPDSWRHFLLETDMFYGGKH